MTIETVACYKDSRGKLHETFEAAEKAELQYGNERRFLSLAHAIERRCDHRTALYNYRVGIAKLIDDNWDHLVTIMKAHGR